MNADEALSFPIQVEANDEGVLQVLRGLANYAEKSRYKMSAVKGARWSSDGRATFRFSSERYRDVLP